MKHAIRKKSGGKGPAPGETVSFDQAKEVRAIARERVGAVKASRPIESKTKAGEKAGDVTGRKAKHKRPPGEEA